MNPALQSHLNVKHKIIVFLKKEFTIGNVYRSNKGNHEFISSTCQNIISEKQRLNLITGDFNLCYFKNKSTSFFSNMNKLGFQQLIKEPTHIQGGHIDHCYWRKDGHNTEQPETERYSPYYSDHDAILIILQSN